MSRRNADGIELARGERLQSLERGLAVLRAFTPDSPALTISEVADRTGLTRATVRRILLTLADLGYVDSERRAFTLNSSVLDLAKPFAGNHDRWSFARPYLESLTERTGESAAVAVGSRLPAHPTSKGRVLLAFLPEPELEAYFARRAIARYTERTVVDEAELRKILDDVRREGFAVVDQQLEEGLSSVAAPITDRSSRVTAALSVCAHAGRVDPATLRTDFLPLVIETARRVSALVSRH